jgi:hypothetical protein
MLVGSWPLEPVAAPSKLMAAAAARATGATIHSHRPVGRWAPCALQEARTRARESLSKLHIMHGSK